MLRLVFAGFMFFRTNMMQSIEFLPYSTELRISGEKVDPEDGSKLQELATEKNLKVQNSFGPLEAGFCLVSLLEMQLCLAFRCLRLLKHTEFGIDSKGK